MVPQFDIPFTYWLDSIPVYTLNEGTARLLDNTRQAYSENYYPLIVPFPQSQDVRVPAGKQIQGAIRPPKGSLLIHLNGVSLNTPGFMLRVFDTATKGDLYSTRFGKNIANVCDMGPNSYHPVVFGPTFIQGPLVVLDDNGWQITIQNMDQVNPAIIQVAFGFAVPHSAGKNIDRVIEGLT